MKEKIIYPEFVARTGQVNTPPGSYDTIKTWIRESFIRNSSVVLEIGCSTSFISYQINQYTEATVYGIDISDVAIEKAKQNCEGIRGLELYVANAGNLPFEDNFFSHVIIGGHLPFVPAQDRKNHIKEAERVLRNNGYLLSSIYYFKKRPPSEFVDKLNKEFNMYLSADADYDYWTDLFGLENFICEFEKRYEIYKPDENRREIYLARFSDNHREDWRHKVNLFSENAEYLQFFIKVMRKVDPHNPYLQIPRGGIYTWQEIQKKL